MSEMIQHAAILLHSFRDSLKSSSLWSAVTFLQDETKDPAFTALLDPWELHLYRHASPSVQHGIVFRTSTAWHNIFSAGGDLQPWVERASLCVCSCHQFGPEMGFCFLQFYHFNPLSWRTLGVPEQRERFKKQKQKNNYASIYLFIFWSTLNFNRNQN